MPHSQSVAEPNLVFTEDNGAADAAKYSVRFVSITHPRSLSDTDHGRSITNLKYAAMFQIYVSVFFALLG